MTLQAVTIRGQVGQDGVLRLKVPLGMAGKAVEAVIVIQVTGDAPITSADAPLDMAGVFALLDSMPGDDLIERLDQGIQDVRDPIE